MSSVRGIDGNGDWLFGKGKNDYKRNNDAVAQNIQTRLQSFLGDCFFAIDQGIDWFNLLGAKNELALTLAVSSIILNTEDVVSIDKLNVDINPNNRNATMQYTVTTVYSTITSTTLLDPSNLV